MQLQDTHGVVPIPTYGTDGQLITPAAHRLDERERARNSRSSKSRKGRMSFPRLRISATYPLNGVNRTWW